MIALTTKEFVTISTLAFEAVTYANMGMADLARSKYKLLIDSIEISDEP